MKESEIRQIFLKISNRYNGFVYDDFKVEDWRELLLGVPFGLALENLRKYSLNPENTFPPHPGILAGTSILNRQGPDIPNANETRIMMAERDRMISTSEYGQIPESFREAMRRVAAKSSYSGRRI